MVSMESTLDSVLNEQPPQEAAPEQVQPEPVGTGEQTAAPPAEPEQKQEPQEDKHAGQLAALMAERRRRQELERELEQFRAQHQPKQTPPAEPGEPDPSQYTDAAQYWRDLARWEAKQQAMAVLEEDRKAQEARSQQEQQQRQAEEFQQRAGQAVARGQAKYADFDAKINSGLAPFLSPAMQTLLVSREDGHDVAYWLANNPAETARVAQLPPLLMAAEIGAIARDIKTPPKTQLPQTLTQARDARGQFQPAYAGPTPLDDIFAPKRKE